MSRDAFRQLDADIFEALADVPGMRCERGKYTAPGSNLAIDCRLYLDEGAQALGDFGQVIGRRDEMRILTGDGLDLRQGGRVFIENVPDSGVGETWQLDKSLGIDDGSISGWVVRHV